MLVSIIKQFAVNLVAQTPDLMLLYNLGNLSKLVSRNDAAGRVTWRTEHNSLSFLCTGSFNLFCCRVKTVHTSIQMNNLSIAESRKRLVRNITRLADNNLIARVQNRTKHKVQTLTRPNSRQNLSFRIVVKLIAFKVFCNFLAQLNQAPVRCIRSVPLFQMVKSLFPHNPWSRKVRLTDTQRNNIIMSNAKLKKLTDSRRRNFHHL